MDDAVLCVKGYTLGSLIKRFDHPLLIVRVNGIYHNILILIKALASPSG